jgi:hypothetical protein
VPDAIKPCSGLEATMGREVDYALSLRSPVLNLKPVLSLFKIIEQEASIRAEANSILLSIVS